MSAVREVALRKRQIDATFARARGLASAPDADAIQADYARHLCILLSGFVEKSLADIVLEYAREKAAATIRSYMESVLARLTNVDKERLLQLVGSFDAVWRDEIDAFVIDEKQAALNSIVGLRNNIAHGGGGGISLLQVEKYWFTIQEIVDFVEARFLASPPVFTIKAKKRK